MLEATRRALVGRLSRFDTVVEIGVGNRPEIARDLAVTGVEVTATDIHECTVPSGVTFVCDDVTDPHREHYADADAVYALNIPPELHRPAWKLALDVEATLLFTTLGSEQPAVPVERESLPDDTLYIARTTGPLTE